MSPQHDGPDGGSQFQSRPNEQLPTPGDQSAKKSSRIRILIFLALVIAAFLVAFRLYTVNKRHFVTTDDANIEANRVSISAKLLGRVSQLMADEGDTVHVGQVLVRLDDSDLKAHEVQARAASALAQESIVLARVSLKRAEADFQRAKVQFQDHVISKEQFDHAQNEYEQAKARVGIAEAQAQTAAAQLGVVEAQLDNTTICSPLDGVVSKRWVLTGDVVQPSQSIFAIYDMKNIWVTANIEETRIGELHEGLPVELKIDAYPHRAFKGKVMQIATNTAAQFSLIPPNNAAGNFTKITQRVPVKIAIDPWERPDAKSVRLLPGMSVSIKVKVH